MTGAWPWIVAVAVVGLALAGWRRQLRLTARHTAAVQEVLAEDRVIQQLEQQSRLPAREREDHSRD